jgi:hypothetical protein
MKVKKMIRVMLLFCGFIRKQREVQDLEFHVSEHLVFDTMNGQITQLIILCNGFGSIHIGGAGDCYPSLGLILSWNLATLFVSSRYQKRCPGFWKSNKGLNE